MNNKLKQMLEKVTGMMKPFPVYLVGGAVRDYVMGNEPKDYDFCTPVEPDHIEELIKQSGRRAYLTGKRFGTIGCKIEIDGKYEMVEITTFRSEIYEPGNRKPNVKYVSSITEDLSRRDFTINSMAMRLTKGHIKIIDPFGGGEDIEAKTIRAVGEPKHRFKEDPLRILRAIRFASRYGYEIEEQTLKKLKKMAIHLTDISKERWMIEMNKILMSTYRIIGLQLLWENEIFKWIMPELQLQFNYDQNSDYHDYVLHQHTKLVVQSCPEDLNMRWAALFHDVAKPFVRTNKFIDTEEKEHPIEKANYVNHEILGAEIVKKYALYLKWPKQQAETVTWLVRNHLKEDCPLRQYDNNAKRETTKED